jgi:hypothetical protein
MQEDEEAKALLLQFPTKTICIPLEEFHSPSIFAASVVEQAQGQVCDNLQRQVGELSPDDECALAGFRGLVRSSQHPILVGEIGLDPP